MNRTTFLILAICVSGTEATAEDHTTAVRQTKGTTFFDAFRQLDEALPTPSEVRLASGAPGPDYWQQRADYRISASIDEVTDQLTGEVEITYHNRSPHMLDYLWMHLDQNRFARHSAFNRSKTAANWNTTTFRDLDNLLAQNAFPGGMKILSVTHAGGPEIPHVIVGTQMRLDLKRPLAPDSSMQFVITWTSPITPIRSVDGRAGVEQLEGEHRKVYTISQWYPRMTAYTDVRGWHIKQFLGTGEFALEFGDFDVQLSVPADHVVSATGTLENADNVLTERQRARLSDSMRAPQPVYIVTQQEADENDKTASTDTKTWHFKATNVRDFAFASSRSFIWQCWGRRIKHLAQPVAVMAFFPKECSPLWDKFAVHATAQALEVYSNHSVPYPYPVMNTVNYGSGGGMEYPMITFNAGRVEVDKKTGDRTYSRGRKNFLIGVIIHETGHQFFPMMVNSDERQWMWMDEGVNSFLQSLAERGWNPEWKSRARRIATYMAGQQQVPIMTQADQLQQTGPNAYSKVTAALTVLREVVLGREQFDRALHEYSTRWVYKRPMPADLFRSFEDTSGVDLDWFWRGWFYSTDHVDLAIDDVRQIRIHSRDPRTEKEWEREKEREKPTPRMRENNGTPRIETHPGLKDFYNEHDEFTVTAKDLNDYDTMLEKLKPWQRDLLATNKIVYAIRISNLGGLVMPVPLELTYADGSTERRTLHQSIWRRNPKQVLHLLVADKEIVAIHADPQQDMYDADYTNNRFPRRIESERMEVKKDRSEKNLMREIKEPRKSADENLDDQGKTEKQNSAIPAVP